MEIILWLVFLVFSAFMGFAYYRTCKNAADELMQQMAKKDKQGGDGL